MKTQLISLVILIANCMFAQTVTPADSITPEDLGGYKWILTGKAKKGEVLIFRTIKRHHSEGKELTWTHDTIHYAPDEIKKGTVFFLDPNYFRPELKKKPMWYWCAMGGTGWISGQFKECSHSDKFSKIKFVEENGNSIEMEFKVMILPYQEVVKLYKDIPAIAENVAWTWSGSPLEK